MRLGQYDIVMVGGSGFMGTRLIRDLSRQGKKVLIFGRSPVLDRPNVDWKYFDITRFDANSLDLQQKVRAKTFIFNSVFKGRYQKDSREWVIQGQVSAPDFDQLFKFLNVETDQLLTFGSSEEYGPKESALDEITEETPEHPVSSHGYWKFMLKQRAQDWAIRNKVQSLHLRPFVVYGLHQDSSMLLGSMIYTLVRYGSFKMTKGEQWRSFVSVETFCSVISHFLDQASWPVSLLNVSSPDYFQIADLAKLVLAKVGRGKLELGAVPYRDFEVWHQKPSLRLLYSLIPHLKHQRLEEGVSQLIQIELKRYDLAMGTRPFISICFCVYNEEKNIGNCISDVRSNAQNFLKAGQNFEILVIDNASTDGTQKVVQTLASQDDHIRYIRHLENKMYSGSHQTAFKEANGEYVAVIDGDNQHTCADISSALEILSSNQADAVFGWKKKREDSFLRSVFSRGYRFSSQWLIGHDLHDINCGFRVFKSEVIKKIVIHEKINSVGPELFCECKRLGYRVKEMVVRHFPRPSGRGMHQSIVPLIKNSFVFFKYLLRLNRRYSKEQISVGAN